MPPLDARMQRLHHTDESSDRMDWVSMGIRPEDVRQCATGSDFIHLQHTLMILMGIGALRKA